MKKLILLIFIFNFHLGLAQNNPSGYKAGDMQLSKDIQRNIIKSHYTFSESRFLFILLKVKDDKIESVQNLSASKEPNNIVIENAIRNIHGTWVTKNGGANILIPLFFLHPKSEKICLEEWDTKILKSSFPSTVVFMQPIYIIMGGDPKKKRE